MFLDNSYTTELFFSEAYYFRAAQAADLPAASQAPRIDGKVGKDTQWFDGENTLHVLFFYSRSGAKGFDKMIRNCAKLKNS